MNQGIKLVSNGTDNHLMLIDLTKNGITGKELEATLGLANITVNKNTIPNEQRSPFVTSGVRVGTPAVTSRGMDEGDMKIIGELIADVIKNGEDSLERVKAGVHKLCESRPLYQ
jgi:glycine hydroxymethyltransferase